MIYSNIGNHIYVSTFGSHFRYCLRLTRTVIHALNVWEISYHSLHNIKTVRFIIISHPEFCPKSLLSLVAASSSSSLIWKRLHNKMSNEATEGMCLDWGAFFLKYRLFPDKERTPDVVVSAFSANDAKTVGYQCMQDLIEAMKDLQPFNDDGPLIIMIDDFYGDTPFQAARQTSFTHMSFMWGNLMVDIIRFSRSI
jgi:hypothetical protein